VDSCPTGRGFPDNLRFAVRDYEEMGLGTHDELDEVLVGAAQGGDRSAFGVLIERHRPVLVAVSRRMLRDSGLAEDVAQEASVVAMLELTRLRRPERFGAWLCGIGLNICHRWLRAGSRDAFSWDAAVGGRRSSDLWPAADDPAAVVEERELLEMVRAAVASLPLGQRRAVTLFYLEGLSHREVGALLGIRAEAVKGRLHKARTNLREWLERARKEDDMDEGGDRGVAMRVADVRRSRAEGDRPERFVVVLEEINGDRTLPIWIGPFEGTAIAMLLSGTEMPRPMTFQFAANLLEAAGADIVGVRIDRLVEGTFYATVGLSGPSGSSSVDARPSDALALSLLREAPVRVSRDVLDAATSPERAKLQPDPCPEDFPDDASAIAGDVRERWEREMARFRSGS
jgi:RNA polymerase sigma factor (sigma-70 family)